jgi:hypothetical protein
MTPRLSLLVLLCAAAPSFGAGPAELEALPEPARVRFCGLLLDTVLDATVQAVQGAEAGAPEELALRKRAFVAAELRLANETLLYGSGSDRDVRVAQALQEQVATLPAEQARPYLAHCVAQASSRADSLRRDVGAPARNVVVQHFLAQRLPPPPTAAAGPVVLPPGPTTGGQDAWFPAEAPASAPAPTAAP